MLVATIAATATWKWITSEGKSSASRMLQREAYQSAVAGIENARSWMTFHGNDVGALVKQFLEDDSHTPINISKRLSYNLRAGQNYSVWVTGVTKEGTSYKIKVLSSGEARNGSAQHTEEAIFNVDGLYQVKLSMPKVSVPTDFDYAYYGGGFHSTQVTVTSAAVNGNWNGNPPVVTKNWIVTGNATLDGNNVSVGGRACIGGNVKTENNGFSTRDLYVGGNFNGLLKDASGDVYFEGNAIHGGTGSINIGGSLTLNGKLVTAQDATDRAIKVKGNLCVDEDGIVVSKGNTDVFQVDGNVWMPGIQNLWYGVVNGKNCTCKQYTYSYSCTYKDCECTWKNWTGSGWGWWGSWGEPYTSQCSENEMGQMGKLLVSKNCTIVDYDGECNQHTNGANIGNIWRPISVKSNIESTSEVACNFGDENLIGCSDYDIGAYNNNYGTYEKIVLGANEGSKVYIKTGYPSTGYESHLRGANKTFVESKSNPRNCDGPDCSTPSYWNNETNKPYVDRGEGTSDRYYVYYMPSGVKDVDFNVYHDSHWNKDFLGYFVNAASNNTETRFTNSHHTQDANHGILVSGKGYYRYLNHDGSVITGSPYCQLASNKSWRPECDVNPWFKSNGTVSNTLPATQPFECAESVKDSCDNLWEKKNGCDGSSYVVKDPLVTGYDIFKDYAKRGCAAEITSWPKENFTAQLQECYDNNTKDHPENLYNGFLVVDLLGSDGNYTQESTELIGKYIIIVEDQLQPGQNGLLNVADNSYVFYYLKNGAKYIQKEAKNSFIYTEGDIGESSGLTLTGTLYSPAEACARSDLKDATLTYNPTLVQELMDAGVICNNDVSSCGGTTSTPSSSSSTGGSSASVADSDVGSGNNDKFYISMAPQLGVTLESQGRSSQPLTDMENANILDSSFIVLPRVIYLSNDPFGELSDYYNIVPLNGSHLKKTDVNLSSCNGVWGTSGSLNTSSKLFSGTEKLTKGYYKCTVKATGYTDNIFWVVIGNEQRTAPSVSFTEATATQQIGASESKTVSVSIPAHAQTLTLNVYCPESKPSNWNYTTLQTNTGSGSICTFSIPANSEDAVVDLFQVTTSGALNGTLSFDIQAGEGYNIGNPSHADVYMASTATLTRTEATSDEINTYCSSHSGDCPTAEERSSWPNCSISDTWVEPTGTSFVEDYKNNSWTISVGGSGTLGFQAKSNKCIVIIPTANNTRNMADIVAGSTVTLRASAKEKKSTLKVEFVGEAEDDARVDIYVGGKSSTCLKSSSPCAVSVFGGDNVSLSIDNTLNSNKDFSYWKCSGASCPSDYAVTSTTFSSFNVTDNETVVYVHFGEVDKHCFFEEFKKGNIGCNADNVEYCIDNCGEGYSDVCTGANDAAGTYTKSKWHLLQGSLSDLQYSNGAISANKGSDVKVISTAVAGRLGTLKALVELPHAEGSNGADKIKNTGFMLRSDEAGENYLMLNVYVNSRNRVEAQVCSGTSCLRGELENGGNMYASTKMTMVTATLTRSNTLKVSAFEGNYYGSPKAYSYTFDLNKLPSSYNTSANQYVGYRLATPMLKLYGIGWASEEYAQECFDAPPTLKCSFAAVAVDGIIPTSTDVTPWIGHSGWFDSKKYSCEEKYYYYNGTDACSGSSDDVSVCPGKYNFSEDGAGQHGYTEAGNEVKTAKAGMKCALSGEAGMWAADPDDPENAEQWRAHCGAFWTGKIKECTDHADLHSGDLYVSPGTETVQAFTDDATVNLRTATLKVLADNPDNSEIEIWLYSRSEKWGGDHFASASATMSGNSGNFDVMETFAGAAGGFDPEKVVQFAVRNNGNSAVTIKSVSSNCANAVGINSCEAKLDGNTWTVTANITNRDKSGNCFRYEGWRDSDSPFSSEVCTTNPTKPGDNQISFTYSDSPYEHQGSHYSFRVYVKPNGASERHEDCSVDPSEIGKITCTTSLSANVVTENDDSPTYTVNLSNCPPSGCGKYKVKLGGSDIYQGECKNNSPTCQINKSSEEKKPIGTYTYSIVSDNDLFSCESRTFEVKKKDTPVELSLDCSSLQDQTVPVNTSMTTSGPVTATGCETGCTWSITDGSTEVGHGDYGTTPYSFTGATTAGTVSYVFSVKRTADNEVKNCDDDPFSVEYVSTVKITTCPADVLNQNPANDIPISAVVTGCDDGCNYTISPATAGQSGNGYTGGSLSFKNTSGTGTVQHTLTVSKGTENSASCQFSVSYKDPSGGTLTCEFVGVNLVGEVGQNISVTSTRENGSYDVYLDGSIVRDSWNNLQSNISINKGEMKNVGGFTIPSGSSHTWKVTAYGSTAALCEGSFTTITTPKVDCYFIDNNWPNDVITGSVAPNKQLQFCTSRASISKQTTLTGKKNGGDINDPNYWISKDNEKTCYYFEAPGKGSYTFKVRYQDQDVCNSNPVLVVQ